MEEAWLMLHSSEWEGSFISTRWQCLPHKHANHSLMQLLFPQELRISLEFVAITMLSIVSRPDYTVVSLFLVLETAFTQNSIGLFSHCWHGPCEGNPVTSPFPKDSSFKDTDEFLPKESTSSTQFSLRPSSKLWLYQYGWDYIGHQEDNQIY